MSELTPVLDFKNNRSDIVAPENLDSRKDVDAGKVKAPTTPALATVALKNGVGEKQKIAVYVESTLKKSTGTEPNRPQLTPPAVKSGGEESDVASLNEVMSFLASLENPDKASIGELNARLEGINQSIQNLGAKAAGQQEEFEGDLANLVNLLKRTQKSIATWAREQNAIDFDQHESDREAAEARDALAMVNRAMTKFNGSLNALLPTGDKVQTDSFKSNTEELYTLLADLRRIVRENKFAILDVQCALFEVGQTALQADIKKKGDEFDAAQADRKKFTDRMKWASIIIGAVLAILSGGVAGTVIGVGISIFMAVDLGAMDGKMTATVINPIIEPIMKPLTSLVEKFVNLVSEAMVAAGVDEATAMAVAAVTVAAVVAITVGVVAKGTAAVGEGVAATEFGKAALAKIEAITASILSVIEKPLSLVQAGCNAVDDAVAYVFQGMMEKVEEYLGRNTLYNFMASMDAEKVVNLLGYLQQTSVLGGTATQSAFTLKAAAADQEAKNISADLELANTNHRFMTKRISDFGDEAAASLPTGDRYAKIISTLIKSETDTVTHVGRKIGI